MLFRSGGVGAFLLGMSLMTESLRQLSGEALRSRLQRTVGGPWAGLVMGMGMTVAMQASSATIMATMGFAPAAAPKYAIAVVLKGTNDEISASTGGRLAGPIAKKVLDYLFSTEGR